MFGENIYNVQVLTCDSYQGKGYLFTMHVDLLFISYYFVKRFGDYFFIPCYIELTLDKMICVNAFYVLRNEFSVESDKRHINFPYTPSVKSFTIGMTLPKAGDFYHGGLWGFFLFFPNPTER